MLAAFRLAGLSALEGHYAGVSVRAIRACGWAARLFWVSANRAAPARRGLA